VYIFWRISFLMAHQLGDDMKILLAAAAVALTTVPLACAHTDVAGVSGIAPFVGTWVGMRQQLDIDAKGNGHFTYADGSACPGCSMATMPISKVTFALKSVSGSTATGSITSDTGKGGYSGPITATVATQFGGQTINLGGGKASGLYCAQAIAIQCGG
jgi:hypothetical protein